MRTTNDTHSTSAVDYLGNDMFRSYSDTTSRNVCFRFLVPSWIHARGVCLKLDPLVTEWIKNSFWIDDPTHGEFTKERFTAKWETVMQSSDSWETSLRDQSSVQRTGISLSEDDEERLEVLSRFLCVDIDELLVGILASEILQRTASNAPEWSDAVMLRACQQEAN